MSDDEQIENKDVWPFINTFLKEYGPLGHQISSYNNFIQVMIPQVIESNHSIEIVHPHNAEIKTVIEFSQPFFPYPSFREKDSIEHLLYPNEARYRGITYSSQWTCTLTVKKPDGSVQDYPNFPMGEIPVMERSCLCNMAKLSEEDQFNIYECPLNPGGTFIINGGQKVVISQERSAFDRPYIYKNRKNSPCFPYYAEVRSSATNGTHTTTTQIGILKGKLYAILPKIQEKNYIPLGVLFKALGILKEKDITSYISEDPSLLELLTPTLEESYPCETQKSALIYIGKAGKNAHAEEEESLSKKKQNADENKSFAKRLLVIEMFPHIGKSIVKKRYYLGMLVHRLLLIMRAQKNSPNGLLTEDVEKSLIEDRDHYGNKRVDLVGSLMHNLFYIAWRQMRSFCKKSCEKLLTKGSQDIKPLNYIKTNGITKALCSCLSTGNWSGGRVKNEKKNGVSQRVERFNFLAGFSNARKQNAPIDKKGKIIEPRRTHQSGEFFICPSETPEGKSCGLLKSSALGTYISIGYDPTSLINLIHRMKGVQQFTKESRVLHDTKIIVNGNWIGYIDTETAEDFTEQLISMKMNGTINIETAITHDPQKKQVLIFTDGGRLMRVVFVVRDNKLVATKSVLNKLERGELCLNDLFCQGILYLLDAHEQDQEKCVVAYYPSDVAKGIINHTEKKTNFTYCELHPCMLFGISASCIVSSNTNQGPRISYGCAMGKQAVGITVLNYRYVFDIPMHILRYTQKPIVTTRTRKMLHFDEMPSGINAIVAIIPFTGYNQEDSVIINLSSVQNGFMVSDYRVPYTAHNQPDKGILIEIPKEKECNRYKCTRTDHLDEQGVAEIGCIVKRGDPLIGRTITNPKGGVLKEPKTDFSVFFEAGDYGVVTDVQIGVNGKGFDYVTVVVNSVRIPELGDKFASDIAQKGTVAMFYRREDMPFTAQGIVPDIIINSLAIPSRMTLSQLISCVRGKACCAPKERLWRSDRAKRSTVKKNMNNYSKDHCVGEGTAFVNYHDYDHLTDISDEEENVYMITDSLKGSGFERNGNELMYNGMTGELMGTHNEDGTFTPAEIFIGPTYYQRLKHMTTDKMHSRSRGPMQSLTRQPTEGRARDGGLRLIFKPKWNVKILLVLFT